MLIDVSPGLTGRLDVTDKCCGGFGAAIVEPMHCVLVLNETCVGRMSSFAANPSFGPCAAQHINHGRCLFGTVLCNLTAWCNGDFPQQQNVAIEAHLCRHRFSRNKTERFDLRPLCSVGGTLCAMPGPPKPPIIPSKPPLRADVATIVANLADGPMRTELRISCSCICVGVTRRLCCRLPKEQVIRIHTHQKDSHSIVEGFHPFQRSRHSRLRPGCTVSGPPLKSYA